MLASLLCALLEEGIDRSIVFWEEQNECDKQQDCVNRTRMNLAQQGVEGVQEALQRACDRIHQRKQFAYQTVLQSAIDYAYPQDRQCSLEQMVLAYGP